ncbi:MAG: lactate racemase domain-containing protein [Thermoprotei archaeon]
MQVFLPYGEKGITAELPETTFVARAAMPKATKSAEDLIASSIGAPIGPSLSELIGGAGGEKRVSVLVTDKTRATPNRAVLAALLPALERAGVKREGVAIYVANGLHVPSGEKTLRELVGDEVYESYSVVDHDSDSPRVSYFGRTSRGTEVYFNSEAVAADLVVGTGLIEPHFFAGYSGGRKLVLPGIASTQTVYQNHSFSMIGDPRSDYGVLEGNPIHEDMVEAVKRVKGFKFIVNVVLGKRRKKR